MRPAVSFRAISAVLITLVLLPAIFSALAVAGSGRDSGEGLGSGPTLGLNPGLSAADPPIEGVDAPASGPFTHVDTVRIPPHMRTPIDLAVTPDGTLHVADGRYDVVDVFDSDGRHVRLIQRPGRVALGSTADLTLTFRAECPQRDDYVGADIVLALMLPGAGHGLVRAQRVMEFVEPWIGMVDYALHRVGATTIQGGSVPVTISLESTPLELISRLRDIGISWRGDRGWEPAHLAYELLLAESRSDALPIIVFVDSSEDGWSLSERTEIRVIGNRARLAGMLTYSVGLNGDRSWLREFAGADSRTFIEPAPHEAAAIMAHILREAGTSLSGNLIIDDTMSDDVFYEDGSAVPSAIVGSGVSDLRWSRSVLPPTGMTMTFKVRPLRTGTLPTNREAIARYDDLDGVRREFVFPVPEIEVFMPTPTWTPLIPPTKTPTATPTPTLTPEPTPTRELVPIFLPIAVKDACVRTKTPLDIALAIDVSSSMTGEKLAAAKAAATTFVRAIDLDTGRDRAAVIAFDATALQVAPLTSNVALLQRAIEGLSPGLGTRIDRALEASAVTLGSAAARRPGTVAAIVLLTDGAHGGPATDVLGAATEARVVTGADIWTIGLGPDADGTLLRSIAEPGAYRFAPNATGLEAVYGALTEEVGCR